MASWMVPEQARPSPIRAAFDTNNIRSPASDQDRRTHPRYATLFHEGDRATHLIHVLDGLIKLVKHGRGGKDVIVELCGPGAVMGETSLLDGHPYEATAVVMTPSVTLWEPMAQRISIIARDPESLQDMFRSLSARLRESQEALQGLAVERVDTRIAALLVKLAENPRNSTADLKMIPLTRQEMADKVGATLETTIRIISQFIRRGVVQGRNRKLVVTDLRYLKAFAAREVL